MKKIGLHSGPYLSIVGRTFSKQQDKVIRDDLLDSDYDLDLDFGDIFRFLTFQRW